MDSRLKLILKGDPEEIIMLLIRLSKPDVVVPNCDVITQFGDIISCRVRRKYLLDVYNSPDTFSVKAPRLITASLVVNEAGELKTDQDFINPSRRLHQTYTGEGIYFGTVDWGFDIAHKNLRNPDGTTRFKCFWDQNGIYDGNKYGYGCFYSADEINQALKTDTPYQTLGYHPGKEDVRGAGMHGTHVIDIATGTPAVGEGGVAEKCRIVGVQLGNNFVNGSDLALGDSVKLVEALHYIYSSTSDAPCVINMSLGSHGDSHTGKSLVEIAFDHFLTQNPGYAIVQSVGNYYTARCHIHDKLKQDAKCNIEWHIPHRNPAPDQVEIWYPGTDEFSLKLIAPDGDTVADVQPFTDIQISYEGEPFGYVFHRAKEPNTGLNHIEIVLDISIAKGKWIIELTGTKVENGEFHAYCERNDASQSRFSPHQSSSYTTTGSVCNSKHTITAGAYNHREVTKPVVSFSSSGPTVFGQAKPDLLAPGYKIKAARSASSTDYDANNELTDKSGSSMAAPHVAGCIALLFQKYLPERLPIEKTKKLLYASLDPLPSELSKPDKTRSGNGFLNINKLLEPEKNINMNTSTVTRPSRRFSYEHTEEMNEARDEHAPWLHRNCNRCNEALLKEIGTYAFDLYRHFHPRYIYNYSPYETGFTPIALPGKPRSENLQTGDIILSRLPLSGKTIVAVITRPQLIRKEELNGHSTPFDKDGLYVEAFGNESEARTMSARVATRNNITPGNTMVVRSNTGFLDDLALTLPLTVLALNSRNPLAGDGSSQGSSSGTDILGTDTEGLFESGIEDTEWSSSPGINSRYGSAQNYKLVRDQVSSWGVSDPCPYIESSIQEWNANPSIHVHFDRNFDKDPHRSFLNLKRLYQARGIADPAAYFAANIVPIMFFNRNTAGHVDLKTALSNAQTSLTAAGNSFTLGAGTWSFVPRTFNNNINKLSNHALGKAIDINPSENPHIIVADDILVINAVCASLLPNGFLAESDPDNLINLSLYFQQNFNDAWIAQQTQTTLVAAIKKRQSVLKSYASHGFLNLPSALIRGLQNAGLNWGGAWTSAKDFMHFELPNP
jgi:Subtilase family/D-alanyl-D-alanine carboxypeptidase